MRFFDGCEQSQVLLAIVDGYASGPFLGLLVPGYTFEPRRIRDRLARVSEVLFSISCVQITDLVIPWIAVLVVYFLGQPSMMPKEDHAVDTKPFCADADEPITSVVLAASSVANLYLLGRPDLPDEITILVVVKEFANEFLCQRHRHLVKTATR